MSSFAGEPYLQVTLPHYESSRLVLPLALALTAIAWILVVPILGAKSTGGSPRLISQPTLTSPSTVSASRSRSKPSKKGRTRDVSKKEVTEYSGSQGTSASETAALYIPFYISIISCVGLLATSLLVIGLYSPYNTFTIRQVFQSPLLNTSDCHHLLAMAEAAAAINYQEAAKLSKTGDDADSTNTTGRLLEAPVGWQKMRHLSYPTTDLNLVTDPFTAADRAWLANLLDRRMTPALVRIFGLPASSIRANDMFVVRYDADNTVSGGRRHLRKHTDDSDISFNVLLNEDFEGGGTRFWNRATNTPFAHVQPTSGQVLAHSALIQHEGMPVESGTRIILVGFLSVDRKEPFGGKPTGLSVWASWASLAWVHAKIKLSYFNGRNRRVDGNDARWFDHPYWESLFRDVILLLEWIGDRSGRHGISTLVAPAQTPAYFQALDDAAAASATKATTGAASWFAGQQLAVDVDGTIAEEWVTRRENRNSFEEL